MVAPKNPAGEPRQETVCPSLSIRDGAPLCCRTPYYLVEWLPAGFGVQVGRAVLRDQSAGCLPRGWNNGSLDQDHETNVGHLAPPKRCAVVHLQNWGMASHSAACVAATSRR